MLREAGTALAATEGLRDKSLTQPEGTAGIESEAARYDVIIGIIARP
jgi:hypothetical protein